MKLSPCHRFVVLEGVHIDRTVLATLRKWAARRGLSLQDAIQMAILAFNERTSSSARIYPP